MPSLEVMAAISRNRYSPLTNYGILKPMTATTATPQLILVAGPYRSNTGDDPQKITQNLRLMNEVALELFRLGHVPVTGEALAFPLIQLAGSKQLGDAPFNEIFHPLARRLIGRIDAVIRVGGPSAGADEMITLARAAGKTVYGVVAEVPPGS